MSYVSLGEVGRLVRCTMGKCSKFASIIYQIHLRACFGGALQHLELKLKLLAYSVPWAQWLWAQPSSELYLAFKGGGFASGGVIFRGLRVSPGPGRVGARRAAMAAASADAPVPLSDAVPLAATGGGRPGLDKCVTLGETSLGAPRGVQCPWEAWRGHRALGVGGYPLKGQVRPCLRWRGRSEYR